MTEVSSLRYFANVFVGLLFKSNVYMYFGMKTIWIDWTILFVSEKGVGNLCCQFSQRNIGFQTQRSSRASLKGMSFPVLFIDLKSSFYLFFFHVLFYLYMDYVHMLFTCTWRERGRKIEISNIITSTKSFRSKDCWTKDLLVWILNEYLCICLRNHVQIRRSFLACNIPP